MVSVETAEKFLSQEIFISFIGFDGELHHAWGILEDLQNGEASLSYTDGSEKVIMVKVSDIKEIKLDGIFGRKHGN